MDIITQEFFHLDKEMLDLLVKANALQSIFPSAGNKADYKIVEYLKQVEMAWLLLEDLKSFLADNASYWLEHGYRAVSGQMWVKQNTQLKSKELWHPPIVVGDFCTLGDTATIRPGVWLCDNVTVGNGCIVKNSIILPGAKLLGNNMVSDSIIGSNVVLGPGVNIVNQYAPVLSPQDFIKIAGHGEIQGLKRFGAIIGDNTNIAANVRVNPGTVIGRNCFIESSDVRGLVEHNTKLGLWGQRTRIISAEEKNRFSQMELRFL